MGPELAAALLGLGGTLVGVIVGAVATTGSQVYLEKKRAKREADRAKQLVAGELLQAQMIFRSAGKGTYWPPIEDANAYLPTSAWQEYRSRLADTVLTRRPSMTREQAAMVRRLATSGAGVEVVVGKAGAGKTFALDAARDAWQASGIRVIGCALAARAAAELHAGAGIDSYTATGRDFRVGDHIVCLRNDRGLGVVNGTRTRVTVVQPDTGTLTARADDGRTVVLPRGYLDAGHVAHGYAITGHKAQGLTTSHAWVLGSDAIYREWGYVAMSRGRDGNRLYVVAGADTDEQLHVHGSGPTGQATADLARALGRSRAQQLAIDHADAASTRHPGVEDNGAGRGTLRARLHAAVSPTPSCPRERLERQRCAAVHQADTVRQRLEAARRRADRFTGVRRLLRRQDARAAHSEIARLAGDLRAWERRIADLDAVLDRPGERDTGVVRDAGYAESARAEPTVLAAGHAVEAAGFDPPDYLLAVLGARPDQPADRPAWREAVRAIEGYRAAWGITHPCRSLGDVPADPVQRRAHDDALAALRGAQQQLAVDNSQEVMRPGWRSSNDLGVGIG